MISVAFYLIDNQACGDNVDIIVDRLCKLSVRSCKLKKWKIYVTIMQVMTFLFMYGLLNSFGVVMQIFTSL